MICNHETDDIGSVKGDSFNARNYFEGVELYQELLIARWQLYTIEMTAAVYKN